MADLGIFPRFLSATGGGGGGRCFMNSVRNESSLDAEMARYRSE